MNDRIDKLLSLIEENNKLLLEINTKLDKMSKSTTNMDDHINNIMGIYRGYKAPLDYISNAFNFTSIMSGKKEILDNTHEDSELD
jgi:hypothetical protein